MHREKILPFADTGMIIIIRLIVIVKYYSENKDTGILKESKTFQKWLRFKMKSVRTGITFVRNPLRDTYRPLLFNKRKMFFFFVWVAVMCPLLLFHLPFFLVSGRALEHHRELFKGSFKR